METKREIFVSAVKKKIVRESIESIRKEGLKFSVDTLADRLKISKKTVYKYFPDKETLALAIYETYYDDAIGQAKTLIGTNTISALTKLLYLYLDSKMMLRDEIFNKYKLNHTIYSYAAKQNDLLWILISSDFSGSKKEKDKPALRVIIDGTFEKICNDKINPDVVIERLVKLL